MEEFFGGNDSLPEFYNYTPLPKFLKLDISDISGYGIFAEEDIPEGVRIGISHVLIDCISNTIDRTHLFFNNSLGVIRTPLGGYINHKKDSNCNITTTDGKCIIYIESSRNIDSGEELTLNYEKSIKFIDNLYT